MLSDFLSLIDSNFIICGDINVHADVECCDRSILITFFNVATWLKVVTGPTHVLGHTLETLIYLLMTPILFRMLA